MGATRQHHRLGRLDSRPAPRQKGDPRTRRNTIRNDYSTPGGVNDGEELWRKLVKKHNFVLTVNGHVLGDGTGFRTDVNDAGQDRPQDARGLSLRLLIVNPDGTVEVRSPTKKRMTLLIFCLFLVYIFHKLLPIATPSSNRLIM
ncbi:MAG: hypothetical protein O3C21_13565 [Verrucomicrobia bacterium]|nr:hypothetical protein [Verrucomicrobiota bacterium]